MRSLAIIAALSALIPISAFGPSDPEALVPSMESGNYSVHCSEEWTKRGVLDQRMYDYCVRRDQEAYAALTSEVEEYKAYPWLRPVINAAIAEWTKRGSRRETMVAHSVHQEIDAFLDLQYLKTNGVLVEVVAAKCFQEWSKAGVPKWTMILFCYKHATGAD
jgi:hypothetical protein